MNYPMLTARGAVVRHATVSILMSFALVAQEVAKPDPNKPAEGAAPAVLEKFEVTGSRVKRLDYETPSPVITYTAATIEDKGYTTLGEFVQSLPYNSATANSEFTAASFVTGAATINPRGLGSNRVLTLVNGRRSVPYALTNSASGTPQTVFNFNSIPQAAIDRVEFLKDGASAIYGSDAITGVFNVILKKNYSGTSVDFLVSNTLGHDSLSKRFSIFTGFAAKGWDVTASAYYNSRHSNFLSDFGNTTMDYRYLGVKGANFKSTINNPTYLLLTAAQATTAGIGTLAGAYIIPGTGTSNPTKSAFVYAGTSTAAIPPENRSDFTTRTQLYPASENYGGYVNINRTLTANISAFARFTQGRSDIHYVLQPYGFTSTINGLTVPPTNPYNPTGITLTNTATQTMWGFLSGSPRREVRTTTETALAGLRGTARNAWNWETAVNYGRNNTIRDTDLIKPADLQAVLSGTTRDTAYNPFGPSDNPNLLASLFTRSKGLDGEIKTLSYDATLNGSLFQLPWRDAGELGVASGFEYRREQLESNPEPNNFLGFTATTPYRGSRHVEAVYLELSAQVTKWLELQVAGRHERYSDFGKATKPKYAGKLRLPTTRVVNVIIRGSYSESFKAPDLGQLYAPISNATTSASYLDPLRPGDAARQLSSRVGGNPALKPEEGKVKYAGAVFEVPAVKGLSFSADYFDTQIQNVINSVGAGFLLTVEGRRKFPNAIVREPSSDGTGRILFVNSVTNNLGLQLFRGWDFGARYALRNTRVGSFTFTADATNIMKKGSDAGQGAGFFDNTGLNFDVEWRYNYGVNWRYKNWSAAVTADIIGKYFNDRQGTATFAGWGENVYPIINPSITYRGFRKITATLGANNVFDNRPPPNGFIALGFDDRAYGAGALGLSLYLRVRKDF